MRNPGSTEDAVGPIWDYKLIDAIEACCIYESSVSHQQQLQELQSATTSIHTIHCGYKLDKAWFHSDNGCQWKSNMPQLRWQEPVGNTSCMSQDRSAYLQISSCECTHDMATDPGYGRGRERGCRYDNSISHNSIHSVVQERATDTDEEEF